MSQPARHPSARDLLAGPLLGGGGLRLLALSLAADADAVRARAGELAATAAAAVWRSTAAGACRARLVALGTELLGASARLDDASEAVSRHAATAARRADELAGPAWDLLRAVARPGTGR